MDVSARSLARLAAERRFQPATLERVIRLLDVLDAFAADSLIAPRIALKGGTALNVFHATLDRLSVDIDVNYVGEADKARMEEDRPGLEDRILRLLESKGYSVRHEPSEHAGGKWIFRYTSVLGGAGSIEIDINYLFRTPLFGVGRMPSAALGDYRAEAVPVLDIHEIVAGKAGGPDHPAHGPRSVRRASHHRHAWPRLGEDQADHLDDRRLCPERRLATDLSRNDLLRRDRPRGQADRLPARPVFRGLRRTEGLDRDGNRGVPP